MSRSISQRALMVFGGLALAGTLTLAQAAPVSFEVPLSGAQQVPPVQSPGSGKADLTYDASTRVVTWNITFSGMPSQATMAHFHGPAPAGKSRILRRELTTRTSGTISKAQRQWRGIGRGIRSESLAQAAGDQERFVAVGG